MVIICKLAPELKSIGKVWTAALSPSENGCIPELCKTTVHKLKTLLKHKTLSHSCGYDDKTC